MSKIKNFIPELLAVLIIGLSLNLWYLSSVVITEKILPVSYSYIANAVIAVLGTFVGAASAFYMNSKKEEKKEHLAKVNAIRKALFTMFQQINALSVIEKAIAPQRELPGRHLLLPAQITTSHTMKKIDIDSLAFILEDHDPNLLLALSIEQDRYDTALAIVQDRYDHSINTLQPALESAGLLTHSTPPTEDQIKNGIGSRVWHTAMSHADCLHKEIPETIKSLETTSKDLLKLARNKYPGHKFIEFFY